MTCAGTDISPMHYTGLQYDSETSMSHALNRELNMNLGRWLTADAAGKGAVKLDDPQRENGVRDLFPLFPGSEKGSGDFFHSGAATIYRLSRVPHRISLCNRCARSTAFVTDGLKNPQIGSRLPDSTLHRGRKGAGTRSFPLTRASHVAIMRLWLATCRTFRATRIDPHRVRLPIHPQFSAIQHHSPVCF